MSFGDGTAEARVAARYAGIDGHVIAAAQREAEAEREQTRYANAVPQIPATQQGPAKGTVYLRPASEKAIDYLVSLSASRTPHVAEDVIRAWANTVDRSIVSEKIDALKAMAPAQSALIATQDATRPTEEVPAGRYAVTGDEGQTVFVRVDRPTEGQWKGYTFVKIQAGDDLHRVSRATSFALQRKILADGVQESMLRYGREIGSCGHCGRTLTNDESRQAGIGPVCRSKLGW